MLLVFRELSTLTLEEMYLVVLFALIDKKCYKGKTLNFKDKIVIHSAIQLFDEALMTMEIPIYLYDLLKEIID